ncbi:MAG TPA: competence/damage-inducible protein A [Acidimicrobiales bacterium]|nr:competence/damage-inducible protein A [Acidimicrobiales bacterium]
MLCEVVAVGTELLLGQVPDTNSAWVGDRLALAGIDCHFQTRVGDNEERIASAIGIALGRSDAVLVCGGLGPTPDDVTREAVSRALDAPLERDPAMVERIRRIFEDRRRPMAASNLRQADLPKGATFILQNRGTAPGLICPAGDNGEKVVYVVPGVPQELEEMVERAVIPDLERRAGPKATIRSRMLRTWGLSESAVAEKVADRVEQSNPTIAFLARGIDGLHVRITAKAADWAEAGRMLDEEEEALRARLGDIVFGVDDQSMEKVVADLLVERDLTVGVAESLTGGLVASRLAETEGASRWFRGSVVSYHSKVKYDLLGVPEGPVVCEEAAVAMAVGACRALEAEVGLGITGVAGPTEQEGKPVGTVFMAVACGESVDAREEHFPGDRQHVRQFATIALLDMLRRRLLDSGDA